MQPSREDFAEWMQMPVTEWIFGLIARFSARQKELWSEQAWDGNLDPVLLAEARTRADSYASLSESTYEDWLAIDDTATE